MTATDIRDPFTIDPDASMEAHYDAEADQTEQIPIANGTRLTAEQMAERTEEYPYGRRADGTPRSRPGPKGSGSSTGPRIAAAPRPRKSTRPAAAKKNEPDYRPGILGLLQIPAMGLTMLGRQSKNPALQADGMTIAMHAPLLADALNETAKQQPVVARALESIMKAGPYGAIFAAVVPLAMQLAANHSLIPASPQMGVHTVDDLVAASNAQMADMARAAGA
jgi:hypothetical protein